MNSTECSEIDQAARIDEAVGQVMADRPIGPRARCFICGRRLTDPVSIDYGIGPECWRDVLAVIHDGLKWKWSDP